MRLEIETWRPISTTEALISSAAAATAPTLVEASSEAAATMPDSSWVLSAVAVSVLAALSDWEEADDRIDDAADRSLELVGQLGHIGLAGRGGCRFEILLRRLHLFDADQILLEGLRRARRISDLVASRRIGDLKRLVAVGKPKQHVPDPPDRSGDAQHRKNCGTDQHQHDEHADNEREGGDTIQFRQQLALAPGREFVGDAHQFVNAGADFPGCREGTFVRIPAFIASALTAPSAAAPTTAFCAAANSMALVR